MNIQTFRLVALTLFLSTLNPPAFVRQLPDYGRGRQLSRLWRSLLVTRHWSLVTVCVLLFSAANIFAQGSLTPPGAPAPTMKSLAQVEPRIIVNAANTPGDATNTFIISQPGSYYLTGNITGASGKHGISIKADNVTLDLNGFALISGGSGTVRGIDVPLTQRNVCVRNGNVRGWTGDGVHAQAATMLAEKLLLSSNTGAIGLAVGNGSMIRDCVSSLNGTGFYAPDRTQVISCISTENTGDGFNCTSYLTIIDCTSSRNGGMGIVVQGSSSVIRCNASRNIPSGNGITAGAGCTVTDCTAGSNGINGVIADSGSTVRGCTAQFNSQYGIVVSHNCYVIGNTCDQNNQVTGYGGIKVGGNYNRIDGNSSTNNNNGYPFAIYGHNNLVIRNSARAEAADPFAEFGINNSIGTVFQVSGTISTSEPWCNFAY